jgi:hypothetical protein
MKGLQGKGPLLMQQLPDLMKIEFSPGQVPSPASPGAVTRPAASSGSGNAASLDAFTAFNEKLDALPLSRPDKVSAGVSLIASQQYPPEDLVDRIATLLAISLSVP